MRLKEAHQRVARNLGCNRKKIQNQYKKNIRFHDCHVGKKVSLQANNLRPVEIESYHHADMDHAL